MQGLKINTNTDKLAEMLTRGIEVDLRAEVRRRLQEEVDKIVDYAVEVVCRGVVGKIEMVDNRLADRVDLVLVLDGVRKNVDTTKPMPGDIVREG